jgi:glycine hydroxymethyltransferase
MTHLEHDDPALAALIRQEAVRIEETLDLIAAESHPPAAILETLGSVFTTKTIEGYPGHRFHAGCVHADEVETLAVDRARRLFGAEHANVQPHSGTSANLAVYFGLLEVGDRVLAMGLPYGGHLSHGHSASITSRCFTFRHYGLNPDTETIDYDGVRALAREFQPRLIVAGASSYPRLIDYAAMAAIAAEVSALLMVDMAHIAGLVAAKVIPSPVSHSDVVTFTAYKTLMGGRGGVILCRQALGRRIDRAVFPGSQGTSAVNLIAAKALCFHLASQTEFKATQKRTLADAARLAQILARRGCRIVSGGTDTHQVLVDLTGQGLTGAEAEQALETVGIVANRNAVPRDAEHPGRVSGIRLGTSGIAARGLEPDDMEALAALIADALHHRADPQAVERVRQAVRDLARRYPVYRTTVSAGSH